MPPNAFAAKQKPADSELPNRPVEKLQTLPGRGGAEIRNQAGWDDDWVNRECLNWLGWDDGQLSRVGE